MISYSIKESRFNFKLSMMDCEHVDSLGRKFSSDCLKQLAGNKTYPIKGENQSSIVGIVENLQYENGKLIASGKMFVPLKKITNKI